MREQIILEARWESLLRAYNLALAQTFLPMSERWPAPEDRSWEDLLADIRRDLDQVCKTLFHLPA